MSMFFKFDNIILNASMIAKLRRIKSKDELPRYGIALDTAMQDEFLVEWYENVQTMTKRWQDIQVCLGCESYRCE